MIKISAQGSFIELLLYQKCYDDETVWWVDSLVGDNKLREVPGAASGKIGTGQMPYNRKTYLLVRGQGLRECFPVLDLQQISCVSLDNSLSFLGIPSFKKISS